MCLSMKRSTLFSEAGGKIILKEIYQIATCFQLCAYYWQRRVCYRICIALQISNKNFRIRLHVSFQIL